MIEFLKQNSKVVYVVLAVVVLTFLLFVCSGCTQFCENHPHHPQCQETDAGTDAGTDGGQMCVELGNTCNDDTDTCCGEPLVGCQLDPVTLTRSCGVEVEVDSGTCSSNIGEPCVTAADCCPTGGAFDPPPVCELNGEGDALVCTPAP